MSAPTPRHVPEDCSVEQCPLCAPILEAREERRRKLPMGAPTPGPWQHVAEGRGYDVRTVTSGIGELIARRVLRCPDARLIAAAPDLLAALDGAYATHCLSECPTDNLAALPDDYDFALGDARRVECTCRAYDTARAAIAKARGK